MKSGKLLLAAATAAMLAPSAFAQDGESFVRPYWWDKPVVEGLGLAARPNVSYLKALAAVVGVGAAS